MKVSWQAPSEPHGEITKYEVLYYQVGHSNGDIQLTTNELEETITGLNKFTQYSFRIVAYNNNGPGTGTDEVLATTYSDGKYFRYFHHQTFTVTLFRNAAEFHLVIT